MEKRAVVLLSGGLDSAVTLAIALSEGYGCRALSFRYGQRHSVELASAEKVAATLGAGEHCVIGLDERSFRGSALTDDIPVPKGRSIDPDTGEIPVTYVPARNTVFLALALAHAEIIDADAIFIGVNALDYSGYPDCRPDFIRAFETVAALGTRRGREGRPFQIRTPLIDLTKAEIIRTGDALGVDFSLTTSCYDPDGGGRACGMCDSCRLRRAGFEAAGVPDPTVYRAEGDTP
ncbi:7-cyano-7-deazaguanine synthase QueC [bacterium]|nr:7-cyano-7-deazaguanine synthase QueC [bacterium]